MQNPPQISQRAKKVQPSLTLAISARAKELKLQGKDICSLSAGEPDFDTPFFIIEAAKKALEEGITRYGPAAGDPELREAIAQKLSEINNIPTKPENVLVTNGGKQAIYNLFQVILDPGDEVLIPSPYWLSYPEIARLAGAKPVIIKTKAEDNFKVDVEHLEDSINSKTKLIIINSPSNPTGRIIPKEEMQSIADVIRRHPQIAVMSDEIYEYLLADGYRHHSFSAIAPDLLHRSFTVNGFAKSWAMTGWRVGYLAGNSEVIKASIALQSQSTSNVCSFAQKGALAALKNPNTSVLRMVEKYNSRRALLAKGLKQIQGMSLSEPNGAFYAFPQLPEGSPSSIDFCKLALENVGLAMVPGAAFGEDRCIRLSCAVSESTIKDGLSRLSSLFK